jgi:hypothetical protein
MMGKLSGLSGCATASLLALAAVLGVSWAVAVDGGWSGDVLDGLIAGPVVFFVMLGS